MIISTSPSRISLFGGGTDLPQFADKYGGRVLNMAINLRHVCKLSPYDGMIREIKAMGEHRLIEGIPARHFDKKFDLIYEVLRSYYELPHFLFEDTFEGIQSAGLGSSASAAVSMIGAFDRLMNVKQSRMEIAKKAWRMETELGWISGKQDQYAAALGGMNLMEFENGDVWIDEIPKNIALAFQDWCVLLFSGKTRHSSDIQKDLQEGMLNDDRINALLHLRGQTWVARDLLTKGDFHGVGKLLREGWEWKKKSNPSASNKHIDEIFTKAYKLGAVGGKVLGAGGEGCILFIIEPKRKEFFIKDMGLQHLDFSINFDGLQVRETWSD
jgi:D-glycero-alpha-D-manno-heptose-7-phosphate kinase